MFNVLTYLEASSMKKIEKINKQFGESIRKFRESRNFNQEDFAEQCGLSRAYYGRIERGEHSTTIETCERISEALQIHISELFISLP